MKLKKTKWNQKMLRIFLFRVLFSSLSCALPMARCFFFYSCVLFFTFLFHSIHVSMLLFPFLFLLLYAILLCICGHGLVCLIGAKTTYEHKRTCNTWTKRWRWNRYHLPKLKLESLIGFILDGNFVQTHEYCVFLHHHFQFHIIPFEAIYICVCGWVCILVSIRSTFFHLLTILCISCVFY